MIAYLHNLSPIKKSQRDNLYFDMTLQTEDTTYRSVCFSPEKHTQFLTRYESSSPVKLSKFQLKRNTRTNEDKVHINKRSKVDDTEESDVSFDIKVLRPTEKCKPGITTVCDVLQEDTNSVVNVCGRITLQGPIQTIMSKGKALRKQEAVLTDNSATIRLVLWENDISKVSSESTYDISKVVLKEYEKAKYLTLNKSSTIKISQKSISRLDTPSTEVLPNTQCVTFPANGVLSLQRFSSCLRCQSKLVPNASKKTVKCTKCGLGQLQASCQQRLLANVLFQKGASSNSLLLFDDKLKQLFKIYQEQTNNTQTFETLDDDDMMEFLLTVAAKVFYNGKKNVVAIQKI